MRIYRVYFIDHGVFIAKPPIEIECADDRDASKKAQQFVDGYDTELWQGDRLIGRFSKK